MRYTILGSSASIPTQDRGCPSGLLAVPSQKALLDCGEGTTRQLVKLGQALQEISLVWLSHAHLDHLLGVAGFAWGLDLVAPGSSLTVFGNADAIRKVESLLAICELRSLNVDVRVITEGVFYETDNTVWRAFPLRHTVPASGLVVEGKPTRAFNPERARQLGVPPGPLYGRLCTGESVTLPTGRVVTPDDVLGPPKAGHKFAYVADTEPFDALAEFCLDADLLVCEATYLQCHVQRARKFRHMTVRDAAHLAERARARRLALTHISPREDIVAANEEATAVFAGAVVGACTSSA